MRGLRRRDDYVGKLMENPDIQEAICLIGEEIDKSIANLDAVVQVWIQCEYLGAIVAVLKRRGFENLSCDLWHSNEIPSEFLPEDGITDGYALLEIVM